MEVPLTRGRSTGYRTSTRQACMILSRKVLTRSCPTLCHRIPATTNQSVALNRSAATISAIADVSLVCGVKVRPIARCSEKTKFRIRLSASPIRFRGQGGSSWVAPYWSQPIALRGSGLSRRSLTNGRCSEQPSWRTRLDCGMASTVSISCDAQDAADSRARDGGQTLLHNGPFDTGCGRHGLSHCSGDRAQ
jgi:hypothetical protein